MAGEGWLTVDTAELARAATEIGAQKPTIVRTQSTISSTSLPADAFGQLLASGRAAGHHCGNVRKVGETLDQAGRDLDELVSSLRSRQQQYEQAVRQAVERFRRLRSRRRQQESVPLPQ